MLKKYGGGGHILDDIHCISSPYLKTIERKKIPNKNSLNYFVQCSEERLLRVKNGLKLNTSIDMQQNLLRQSNIKELQKMDYAQQKMKEEKIIKESRQLHRQAQSFKQDQENQDQEHQDEQDYQLNDKENGSPDAQSESVNHLAKQNVKSKNEIIFDPQMERYKLLQLKDHFKKKYKQVTG